jgi:hypothetical protein
MFLRKEEKASLPVAKICERAKYIHTKTPFLSYLAT